MDAIKAYDKRHLNEKICMVGTPEADDSTKRRDVHTMAGETK